MSEQQADYKTRRQTIFRTVKNQDNPFVMMDRRPIENPALSWKAKGVLAYLLSRPDNWIVRIGDLVKRSPDGVHAIRGAIKELEKAGHVSRKEIRDGKSGKFVRYELEVYELPFTSRPLTNLPHAVNPLAENLTLNDTDFNENDSNDIQDDEEEQAPQKPNLFIIYQNEIGPITPFIADAIEGWLKDGLPEKWIADGIHEAAAQNKRSWKYVEAILKRWDAQGNQNPVEKPGRTPATKPQAVTRQDQNQAAIASWLAKKQAANNG
jgi:DnaD/phage-associated family protein